MAASPKPSFSPYRKWGTALHVAVLVLVVFSVVVMVNYLGRAYFLRLRLGAQSRPLAPRTLSLLSSITNHVQVTVYYDRDAPFYSTVTELLGEYRHVNHRIAIQLVDYLRDPAAAQLLKNKYSFLAAPTAKDLVIFDCDGRIKPVDGASLTQYALEQIPNEKEREFRRKPVAFAGEREFTRALLAVTSPKPLKAYFLQGHGEHSIADTDEKMGYSKLASVFEENCVTNEPLSLLGTNTVPMDCSLLVIPGPTRALDDLELDKIDQYLNQGGRLLLLFNVLSLKTGEIGLEKILAKWGVDVGENYIIDPERTLGTGQDVIVETFGNHPIVNPLLQSSLHLVLPRSIGKLRARAEAADAPKVQEIAFSGPKSFSKADPKQAHPFPLIVAVEKGAVKDVITDRGTTRMVVGGDSIFLANHQIESAGNRDFAGFAANWLLDRPQLLEGIPARQVVSFRIVMTKTQLQSAEWLLLGGLPGGMLFLGTLVWLRRRS